MPSSSPSPERQSGLLVFRPAHPKLASYEVLLDGERVGFVDLRTRGWVFTRRPYSEQWRGPLPLRRDAAKCLASRRIKASA